MALDPRRAANRGSLGGALDQQLALQTAMSEWQQPAQVAVIVQNGLIVTPVQLRAVPIQSTTLAHGTTTKTKPVQDVVIALEPAEVAKVTEALAVGAKLTCVPRSGHPDDPKDSVTPGRSRFGALSAVHGPGTGSAADGDADTATAGAPGLMPLTVVETIGGATREVQAVPRAPQPAKQKPADGAGKPASPKAVGERAEAPGGTGARKP